MCACGCVCVCDYSKACKVGLNSHLFYSTCHLSLSLSLFFYPLPSMFQEAHVFIGAEKVEDVTEERIRAELSKVQAQAPTQWVRRSSRSTDKEELVVSLLQYCIYPSDGDRDFYIHVL